VRLIVGSQELPGWGMLAETPAPVMGEQSPAEMEKVIVANGD
jgi:hypothetical protein